MSGSCSCECVLDITRNKVVSACGAHAEYTRREIAHVLRSLAKKIRDKEPGAIYTRAERIRLVPRDAVAKQLEDTADEYYSV